MHAHGKEDERTTVEKAKTVESSWWVLGKFQICLEGLFRFLLMSDD